MPERTHRLQRQQLIPRPRDEVFAFFADAANLEAITPPFLHFRILTRLPIEMRQGKEIEYVLSLIGVPLRWRTRISVWEPGVRFVDEQQAGPYALWRHRHEFESVPGGTRMVDVVDYALPFGPLGTAVHTLLVKRTLERIFDFRQQAIEERLGAAVRGAPHAASAPRRA
jgi:ligand-binding SRPBCC domain-containing protein